MAAFCLQNIKDAMLLLRGTLPLDGWLIVHLVQMVIAVVQ